MRLVIARADGRGVEFPGSGRRWRIGTRALLVSIGTLMVAPVATRAQNLIQTPGFEGCTQFLVPGVCSPWVFSGSSDIVALSHSGSNAANLFGGGATVSQVVTLTKSGLYNFSFWYANPAPPPFNAQATASIGGQQVFNQTLPSGTFPYTQFSTNVTLSSGANSVVFGDTGGFNFVVDDVSLTLILALQTLLTPNLPVGAPTNVINAAGAVDSFTNNGGTLPTNFQNLFNLSPSQLQAALIQLDGEASTDAEKGAFELMNQFMGLMLDPFVAGRMGSVNGTSIGFAPEQQASFAPEIAQAYASVFKAPPMAAPPTQQWTAWGSGFGASSKTDGNASVGSNNVTAANYGFAGGMDYHYTPDSLVGFALAGAGTNWNLAQGLGGGRSDAFQAGVYTKSYYGPAYVAGALAFANNWFTTDRSALGDELHASFIGQSYGGRFESGYRFGLPASGSVIGATPYAAVQTQWFHTPTYGETDLAGGGLGLTYNSMTANDTRSELGARFDDLTALNGMPLILRTRLAWAHDWVTNPALNAVFESLPGSSFIVNGAKQPADSALVSTGAELHMTARWSLAAKFDGEFANGSQTYGGTGTLRYTW